MPPFIISRFPFVTVQFLDLIRLPNLNLFDLSPTPYKIPGCGQILLIKLNAYQIIDGFAPIGMNKTIFKRVIFKIERVKI
jgi:hypothetical protein